ncbi:minichromosome maintenance 10 homolog isoform X1 [Rhynchophorus ferrugineus]|uniref:minichromosome maintenance 10 homolog isoform X1 n=1 Tax=Rhynchophorus ferrugineus TaxID=354439 RepID=UPI003FCE6085
MNQEDDLLESLLAVATEELEKFESDSSPKGNRENEENSIKPNSKTYRPKIIKETNLFGLETNIEATRTSLRASNLSEIHNGDTDSSDDEGNRNYENQKYNDCGKVIKKLLSSNSTNSISSSHYGIPKKRTSSWTPNLNPDRVSSRNPKMLATTKNVSSKSHVDVFIDPVFGMRIINPLISSTMLTERMQGRIAVKFSDLIRFIGNDSLKDKDWVICGVVVSKSPPKTSQKGSQFSIWTLSDLKDDIKTVALFMFSGAHTDLWKTIVGTVIGVLNPNIMERRDGSKDVASLSVDTSQKVMVFGQSKDFGLCKSIKKNGEKCTSIVNLSKCEFCVYHIKQEYQKCSKRSELQSNFAGKGLVNLRNKVLGKNEVFYAGKSYVAIPAKKSKKLEAKDDRILQNLNGLNGNVTRTKTPVKKKKGMAMQLDINPVQRAKDLELLKKLGGSTDFESKTNFSGSRSNEISLADSKATALSVISKLKSKSDSASNVKEINNKYDLKGDLHKNLEMKNKFSGKMSGTLSLSDSKQAALNVITKLKENTNTAKLDNNINLFKDVESEFDDLKYTDDEEEECASKLSLKVLDDSSKQIKSSHTATQSPSVSKHNKNKLASNEHLGLQSSKNVSLEDSNISKSKINSHCDEQKAFKSPKQTITDLGIPKLSAFGKNDFIDLSKPVTSRQIDRAKINALKFIEKNGPIMKIDPNSTKKSGKKRPLNTSEPVETPSKKSKLQESEFISDRFKKMMAMSSRHSELIEQHDDEEKEKYFQKQEMKEKMEEKMANTFKVSCKAVKCLTCKYVSFSASDFCKKERHPLKVFDATKRFYKCSNCQYRTATLEIFPTKSCQSCGSSKWERTGMMKEKIIAVQHQLSIRGGEQTFINSVAKDANLDLLIPDD